MNDAYDPAGLILGSLSGSTASKEELEFIQQNDVAGVTLFSRNLAKTDVSAGLRSLTGTLQEKKRKNSPSLLIAIDQEGGRVSRLRGNLIDLGPAANIHTGNLAQIRHYGCGVGSSLLSLGINVNFAPVLDIQGQATNAAIGDRAYGKTPAEVESVAGEFLAGLNQAGIIPCLKHFPGQGRAEADTHLDTCTITANRNELEEDLQPFKALLPFSPMVMLSHCRYLAWDPDNEACKSTKITQKLLRQTLKYEGVIVSDDMTMAAVQGQSKTEWLNTIKQSILNGVDLILICEGLALWQEAVGFLREEMHLNKQFAVRVKESRNRVDKVRANFS